MSHARTPGQLRDLRFALRLRRRWRVTSLCCVVATDEQRYIRDQDH